jgi:hypothetical protein
MVHVNRNSDIIGRKIFSSKESAIAAFDTLNVFFGFFRYRLAEYQLHGDFLKISVLPEGFVTVSSPLTFKFLKR